MQKKAGSSPVRVACESFDNNWDTQEKAYNQCWEASLLFQNHLKLYQIQSEILSVSHPIKKVEILDVEEMLMQHFIVHVKNDDCVYDWTARQIWPNVEYPLIIPRWKLGLYWGIIETLDQTINRLEGVMELLALMDEDDEAEKSDGGEWYELDWRG